MTYKVFGHTPPDTDSVCSPVAYAWYLSTQQKQDAQAYILGDMNKETEFVLARYDIDTPEQLSVPLTKNDQVVILDTNNPDELPEGIQDAVIAEIIDHHKLVGGLSTESPISMLFAPIACTATILWEKMKGEGTETLPKHIAGVLLCAIVSDTLNNTSPTTTDRDRSAMKELAELVGEDIDALATEMFAAKSDLTGMSPEDILKSDSKIFPFGSKKVRVSVLETTAPQNALDMAAQLREGMDTLKKEEGLDYAFFFAVDILNTEATLIVPSDEEKSIAQKAFDSTFDGEYMKLPGVVSRKKQIVPALEPVIAS